MILYSLRLTSKSHTEEVAFSWQQWKTIPYFHHRPLLRLLSQPGFPVLPGSASTSVEAATPFGLVDKTGNGPRRVALQFCQRVSRNFGALELRG